MSHFIGMAPRKIQEEKKIKELWSSGERLEIRKIDELLGGVGGIIMNCTAVFNNRHSRDMYDFKLTSFN